MILEVHNAAVKETNHKYLLMQKMQQIEIIDGKEINIWETHELPQGQIYSKRKVRIKEVDTTMQEEEKRNDNPFKIEQEMPGNFNYFLNFCDTITFIRNEISIICMRDNCSLHPFQCDW